MQQPWLIAKAGETDLYLLPQMSHRHGLITGITGTGKTVSLQVMVRHARAAFLGQETTVTEPGGATISGVVLGLDESGALRLRLPSGTERRMLHR